MANPKILNEDHGNWSGRLRGGNAGKDSFKRSSGNQTFVPGRGSDSGSNADCQSGPEHGAENLNVRLERNPCLHSPCLNGELPLTDYKASEIQPDSGFCVVKLDSFESRFR